MHSQPFTRYTDADLRARYRDLMDMANRSKMDRDEALDLLAVAAELGARGYTLNADETDWIPKGESDATE